jgi:hypothetical protein
VFVKVYNLLQVAGPVVAILSVSARLAVDSRASDVPCLLFFKCSPMDANLVEFVFHQLGSPPCSPSVVVSCTDDGKAQNGVRMLRQR